MLFIGKYHDLSMFTGHRALESNELVMYDKLALCVLCFNTKVKQNKNMVVGRKLSLTDECFRNLSNFYKSLASISHAQNEKGKEICKTCARIKYIKSYKV